jgi:hypothetical protein
MFGENQNFLINKGYKEIVSFPPQPLLFISFNSYSQVILLPATIHHIICVEKSG